ncbi:hypothetical protein PhCBS80983_g04179 [Powellomyces hirtus]|uniref:L-ornithine N(5)-monooxygenase [NAD(P)H] n=1 Tax=Powellomyces hirtus TaxID=109895 RepID=A0A507E1L9_9FUNG|nr:hypothetical protein PhCBS80983_g04179 [Powellomyces hirtus]
MSPSAVSQRASQEQHQEQEAGQEHCYDVLCVGFGPASLSLATAMADTGAIALATNNKKADRLAVKFIEKQPSFLWHGGMLIDGTKMQISFLKDLATLRDPTSRFTFLNYLHQNKRLVPFTNRASWNPYRVEFNDYLSWVARHFDHCCDYGEQVLSVEPVIKNATTGSVDELLVTSLETATNKRITRRAKNIVVAIGGQPRYPPFALKYLDPASPHTHPRITHSSQYTHRVSKVLPDPGCTLNLAVVGAGQSAAEVFVDLTRRYPNATVTLIFRDSALRPSDASPFVNEVFDPDRRETFFSMTPDQRTSALCRDAATNYSVVNPTLIEDIYDMMYRQQLPGSETKPKHSLLPSHNVVDLVDSDTNGVSLVLESILTGNRSTKHFAAVFLGTGYVRQTHLDILKPIHKYLPDHQITVTRNYRLNTVDSFTPGVYLQGCCERTHGLSDTLLSVLSVRGGEVLADIEAHTKAPIAKAAEKSRLKTSQIATLPDSPPPSPPVSSQANPSETRSDFSLGRSGTQSPAILFSKHIPHLNETLTLRVAALSDVPLLTEWHNKPRVAHFWNERGDEKHHHAYLSGILASPHSIPVLALFDSEPFAYFEVYDPVHSPLGKQYEHRPHDRGIHMLVGSDSHRGPHRVAAWLPGLLEYCFEDPRTTRVVSEPRIDNGRMVGYLANYGFAFWGARDLGHKVAAVMGCERQRWEAMKGRDVDIDRK